MTRLHYLFILLALFTALVGNTQVEIINLAPQVDQFRIEHLPLVNVINRQPVAVIGQLVAKVSSNQGEEILSIQSFPIEIIANGAISFSSISWQQSPRYSASFPAVFALNTGFLPPGQYIICHEFIERGSQQIIGVNCQEQGIGQNFDFELVYPFHQDIIETVQPILSWEPLPIGLPNKAIDYHLRLVEVSAKQNPLQALQTGFPLINGKFRETSLMYPSGVKGLEVGHTYAWQVQAYSAEYKIAQSSVWVFTIAHPSEGTEKTITNNMSYAMLDNEISHRYYRFTDKICFAFNNIESMDTLNYSIRPMDAMDQEIAGLPVVSNLTSGLNTIAIDRTALTLQNGEDYLLAVHTPGGQNYFIRFKCH